jgi:Domain of unknown function (DUF3512)
MMSLACFFAVFDHFYKDYGVFSTHAPVYNSKGAVFTKDEIDMIRSAYGSDRGTAYVERLVLGGWLMNYL